MKSLGNMIFNSRETQRKWNSKFVVILFGLDLRHSLNFCLRNLMEICVAELVLLGCYF